MALWVVVGHVILLSGYKYTELSWPINIVARPVLAVYVFMILSGFVITHLITTKQESYGHYIWRRWLRLFPLLASLVSFVVLFAWFAPRLSPFRYNFEELPAYLIAYATMMHGAIPNEWLPRAAVLFFSTPWSISTEWQFYLVAPALVWIFATKRYLGVALVAVLAFATFNPSYTIFGEKFTFLRGSFLLSSLVYFLVGIASYHVVTILAAHRISREAAVAAAAVVFMTTGSYPFAIWALALLAITASPSLGRPFQNPWLVWLGERSYSLYLTHMIVLMMVRSWILNPIPFLEPRTPEFALTLMFLTVPLTIGVSILTYRYIEQPFIALGNSKKLKLRPAG